MSSLTSTTTSAISLSNILIGATIAISALIVLLFLNEVLRSNEPWNAHTPATRRLQMVAALLPQWRDSWNANTAAALRAIYTPLLVTFVACVVFTVARAI